VLANFRTLTPAVRLAAFDPGFRQLHRTARKIVSFTHLPNGWHYGQGGPITTQTLRDAFDVYMALLLAGFTSTDAFAGAGYEVLVTAYTGDEYIGVIVEPNGQLSLRHESADEERFYRDKMAMSEVKQKIDQIAGEILWSSYGFSIREISTEREMDSTISRSRPSMAASPSFIGNALIAFRALSANI